MSAKLPELPKILTQPLACRIDRCNNPRRYLPTIPTNLETLLRRNLLDRFDIDTRATDVAAANVHLATLDDFIISQTPTCRPEEVSRELVHLSSAMREQVIATRNSNPARAALCYSELLVAFAADTVEHFETVKRQQALQSDVVCVHDVLDPSAVEGWLEDLNRRAGVARDVVVAGEGRPSPRALFSRLLATDWSGSARESDWREGKEEMRELMRVRGEMWELMRKRSAKANVIALCLEGFRSTLGRPGAIIAILSHFLYANPNNSSALLRAFASASSQLAQLFRFIQSPLASRRLGQDHSSALSHNTTAASSSLPVPISFQQLSSN